MRIVCTTGMYTERDGIPYTFRALPVEEIAEIYIAELTEGIGDTGIRAGLIKLATGSPITAYEKKLCAAAGMASREVGCPVITHTEEASHGLEQLELLAAQGVPAHRVLVGHSDGRADPAYHASLAERGAYVGFDRFGIEPLIPDAERIESVLALLRAGHVRSLCISHDATCGAWLGRPVFGGKYVFRPEQLSAMIPNMRPTHIFEHILPDLLARGVSQAQIDTILIDNPRRYFEAQDPPYTQRT
jgi:phosphotriesterase-related protein